MFKEKIMAQSIKKEISLTFEQAKEIYTISKDEGFKKALVLQFPELIVKRYIPKHFEELEDFNGYFIKTDSEIEDIVDIPPVIDNRNVCATEDQAESILAFCQVTQLMRDYYEQIERNPSDGIPEQRYSIIWDQVKVEIISGTYSTLLVFRTKEDAINFYRKNKSLIDTYFGRV